MFSYELSFPFIADMSKKSQECCTPTRYYSLLIMRSQLMFRHEKISLFCTRKFHLKFRQRFFFRPSKFCSLFRSCSASLFFSLGVLLKVLGNKHPGYIYAHSYFSACGKFLPLLTSAVYIDRKTIKMEMMPSQTSQKRENC